MDNGRNPLGSKTKVGLNEIQNENTFSSSTFQEIFDNKLNLSPKNNVVGQSIDKANRDTGKVKPLGTLEESEVHSMADLLPDDDDLLSAIWRHNTDCKCRGFVIISYYDLRAARNAICALQNQPLMNQKLDIQFGIPKDNPSHQDTNQGTQVIFNHDSSISREAIYQMFSVYGAIRQIREIPNMQDQTCIEFYDVRSVEAALHALNQSDIGGKRIMLQHSCPQGVKRFPTQQLSPEFELEESSGCWQGNDSNSSSGCSGSTPLGTHNSTGTFLLPHYANLMPAGSFMETIFPGESSQERISCTPITVASLGSQPNLLGHRDGFHYGLHNSNNMPATRVNCRPSSGVDTSGLESDSFRHSENALGVNGMESCPLHVQHYPNTYYHHHRGPLLSPGSTTFVNTMSLCPLQQLRGLQFGPSQMMNAVCSLPSDNLSSEIISNPLYWRLKRAFPDEPTDPPALQPGSLGNKELSGTFPYEGEH